MIRKTIRAINHNIQQILFVKTNKNKLNLFRTTYLNYHTPALNNNYKNYINSLYFNFCQTNNKKQAKIKFTLCQDENIPQIICKLDIQKYIQVMKKENPSIVSYFGENRLQQICMKLTTDDIVWEEVWLVKYGNSRILSGESVNKKQQERLMGQKIIYADVCLVGKNFVYRRINDFPEQPLYTIIVDDVSLFHINDNMANWKVAKKLKQEADKQNK